MAHSFLRIHDHLPTLVVTMEYLKAASNVNNITNVVMAGYM